MVTLIFCIAVAIIIICIIFVKDDCFDAGGFFAAVDIDELEKINTLDDV